MRRGIIGRILSNDSGRTYVASHEAIPSLFASVPVLIISLFILSLLRYAPEIVRGVLGQQSWALVILSVLTAVMLLSVLGMGLYGVLSGLSVTVAAINALRHPTHLIPRDNTLQYSFYDAEKRVRRDVALTPASILRCMVERRSTLISEGGRHDWEPMLHLVYREGETSGYLEIGGDRRRVDLVLRWLTDHQVPISCTFTDLALVPFKQRPRALSNVPSKPLTYQGMDDLMARFEEGVPVSVYYRSPQ